LYVDAFLLELAHKFRRLVGGHSAGDAKCHAHNRYAALFLAPLPFPFGRFGRGFGQLIFEHARS
jgi:hypothetical protein